MTIWVLRQVGGQICNLLPDEGAEAAQDRKGQGDRQ